MHTHLFIPFAPLVLRTGKPFGETGGGDTFPFPLPSTIAGAFRTAHADKEKLSFSANKAMILGWACHGVLPAALDAGGRIEPLFLRPADARYIRPEKDLVLQNLVPNELNEGEGCDMPGGLLPVFLEKEDKSKPASGPVWWSEKAIHEWLLGSLPNTKALGPDPPPIDIRTHVALDPATLAASTGKLYQSAGPDFEAQRIQPLAGMTARGWNKSRYGLLSRFAEKVQPTLVRVGGESRLAALTPCDAWPAIPASLNAALEKCQYVRFVLATPALFSGGWKPGWLGPELLGSPPGIPGLVLRLKAAAVERWQAVSGWDMAARKPKAIRRLAPAGSVYWFEIVEAPKGWAEKLWLTPISDNEQDRRDGFGLVLPGIWKK